MKGFIAPKFTKEDVRKLLTDNDKKQILSILGYKDNITDTQRVKSKED